MLLLACSIALLFLGVCIVPFVPATLELIAKRDAAPLVLREAILSVRSKPAHTAPAVSGDAAAA